MAQALERASTSDLGRSTHSSSSEEAELYLSACSDVPVELVDIEPALIEDGGLEAVEDAFGVHDVLADAKMPEPPPPPPPAYMLEPEAVPGPSYMLDSTSGGQLESRIFFHQVQDAIEAAQAAAEPSLAALPRESRPGTSDESTSRPAASESDSSTESSLLSASSQSEDQGSTLLRNSTGQMSVQSAEDSGVVSDGDGEAYESGNDSPWTRRYANNDAEAFLEEVSEPDEYETESDDLSTPPPETHPRHRAGRAGTPWRKLDKAPSSEELHTAPRGKTRGLSPGHESWSINYISAELLQLIVDQLGPDALFPPTENRLLPGGPYVGHPAPKDVYQQRRVFDLFRWRSWFLGLRQLSKRFASAVFQSSSSWMTFIQLVCWTDLGNQPGSPFQLARLVLRHTCCVVCLVPGQFIPNRGYMSKPVFTLSLGTVPMCPMHARLCTAPGPRKWLSCHDCLLIETDSRGMSICFDHIAFPLSKKMDANLCSDCRQDQLELQLMSKYGQRPLNQTAYCESLEVYAYMWEGARTAVYAARKAMEHFWLSSLWHFKHWRDVATKQELASRARTRLNRARLSSALMPSMLAYVEEESDDEETAEAAWNDPEVRETARRQCLSFHGRDKFLNGLWFSEDELSEMPLKPLVVSGPLLLPSLPIDEGLYGPGMPTGHVERDAQGRLVRQWHLSAPSRELRTKADILWTDEVLPHFLGLPLHNIARHLQQEHGQKASDFAARTTVQGLLVLLRHKPFWHRNKKAKKGFANAPAKQDEESVLPALPFSYSDVGIATCAVIEEIWTAESAFLSECACGICLRQKRKRETGDDGKANRSGTGPAAAQVEQKKNDGVDAPAPDSREATEWEDAMGGDTPDNWSNLTDAEEEVQPRVSTREKSKTELFMRLINNCDAYGEEQEFNFYEDGEETESEEEEEDDDDDNMSDTARQAQEARARSCAEALGADYLRE